MSPLKRWMPALGIALAAVLVCVFQGSSTADKPETQTVLINITSSPEDVLQLTTAFHVAADALNSGRHVILLFNGRGVRVPVKRLSPDLRLGDERALWVILDDLVRSGAEVVVARQSARILNMVDAEFIPQTQIREWGGDVFCKLPANSVVFSY